jgi:hypothetical protein
MGAMTDKLEQDLLKLLFRNTAYAPPASVTVKLLADVSNIAAVEAGTVTVVGSGVAVSCSTGWEDPFESGTAYAVKNKADITFGIAQSNLGTVNGVGIYNDTNLIFYGALTNPRTINQGDQFVFPSGSLKVTFN